MDLRGTVAGPDSHRHPNPVRAALHRYSKHPNEPGPLGPSVRSAGAGPLAVQVLRTYPALRDGYPFAPGRRTQHRPGVPQGVRTCSPAGLPRGSVPLVDRRHPRGWSTALEHIPSFTSLRSSLVIPTLTVLGGPASRIGRKRVIDALHAAGPGRVAVYDLENSAGTPIYVHSKVCIIDDVWIMVGSDNLNRRSWTHDSELSCAVIDSRNDHREPADPAGLGDGARVTRPRTRIRLAREHLELNEGRWRTGRPLGLVRRLPAQRRGAGCMASERWPRRPARRTSPSASGRAGPRSPAARNAPAPCIVSRPRRAAQGTTSPRRVLTARACCRFVRTHGRWSLLARMIGGSLCSTQGRGRVEGNSTARVVG